MRRSPGASRRRCSRCRASPSARSLAGRIRWGNVGRLAALLVAIPLAVVLVTRLAVRDRRRELPTPRHAAPRRRAPDRRRRGRAERRCARPAPGRPRGRGRTAAVPSAERGARAAAAPARGRAAPRTRAESRRARARPRTPAPPATPPRRRCRARRRRPQRRHRPVGELGPERRPRLTPQPRAPRASARCRRAGRRSSRPGVRDGDDRAQAPPSGARAPPAARSARVYIASACSWTSNGFTDSAQSPSSSCAPVFSDRMIMPLRVLTSGPSLETRFIPSHIAFTSSRSKCL